jgi:hypothetical protein
MMALVVGEIQNPHPSQNRGRVGHLKTVEVCNRNRIRRLPVTWRSCSCFRGEGI